ncbi:MAG: hypothetical protein V8R16_03465 [Bacilli bacterium]
MIFILVVLFFILISNVYFDVLINEEKLIIKLFKIKILSIKIVKLIPLIEKSTKSNQQINILDNIKFLKVDIVLKTKVNDYQLFFKQNIVIKTMLNNFYFLFNDYLPNLSFKYLKNETNQINIYLKLKINALKIFIDFMKGKIYGPKRN